MSICDAATMTKVFCVSSGLAPIGGSFRSASFGIISSVDRR